ncbi:hypothetical protein K474DRAFT_1562372, partial [Panus rudis PR-1116 ss-1]
MMKVAQKYNVRLDAIKLSKVAKKSLPIWYHVGGTDNLKTLNNSPRAQCLRKNHKVRTIGDLLKIVRRENRPMMDPPHIKQNHCSCQYCREDSIEGCTAPHSCTQCAHKLLQRLHDIWKISVTPPQDNLTLTHRRRRQNERAQNEEDEDHTELIFNPSVTTRNIYLEGIRVFGETHDRSMGPAYRERSGVVLQEERTTIY